MPSLFLANQPVGPLDAYLATVTGGLGRRADPAELAGIASQTGSRRYVVCNGAEGEPEGTFKDRALMRASPHQLVLKGLIIAAFTVDADGLFICLKRSFERELEAAAAAVQKFQAAENFSDAP